MTHNLLMGFHIIAVIAWMAGLLYLPRLFVYHTPAAPDSELDLTFKVMEEKLQKMIMRPAMVAVVVLGAALVWLDGWTVLGRPWMLTKLAGVAFLLWWHHFLIAERKALARGERRRSPRFWRMTNELPFLAAIIAVLAVTTKFA